MRGFGEVFGVHHVIGSDLRARGMVGPLLLLESLGSVEFEVRGPADFRLAVRESLCLEAVGRRGVTASLDLDADGLPG